MNLRFSIICQWVVVVSRDLNFRHLYSWRLLGLRCLEISVACRLLLRPCAIVEFNASVPLLLLLRQGNANDRFLFHEHLVGCFVLVELELEESVA